MNESPAARVKATIDQVEQPVNKASLIFFAAALCGWNSSGQTNSSTVTVKWLTVSPPKLRPFTVGASKSNTDQHDRDETPALPDFLVVLHDPALNPLNLGRTEQVALSSPPGEFDFRTYRMLEENCYLKRPELKSDNRFIRFVNGIFEPVPVRMGKTTVTCSVITAIKRRNPLCLINPLVLTVSW